MTDDATTRWPGLSELDRLRLSMDLPLASTSRHTRWVLSMVVRLAGTSDQLQVSNAALARACGLGAHLVGRCVADLVAAGILRKSKGAVVIDFGRIQELTRAAIPDCYKKTCAQRAGSGHIEQPGLCALRAGSTETCAQRAHATTEPVRDSVGLQSSANLYGASASKDIRECKAPESNGALRNRSEGDRALPNGQKAGSSARRPGTRPESVSIEIPAGHPPSVQDAADATYGGHTSHALAYDIRSRHGGRVMQVVRAFGRLAPLPARAAGDVAAAAAALVQSGRFEDPPAALAWLEGRARQYACSPRGQGRYAHQARTWLQECGYDADDEAWGVKGGASTQSGFHSRAAELRNDDE